MNVYVSPSAAHALNRAECLALLSWTRSPAHAHCQTSSSDVMFGGASKINGDEFQLENLHFSDMKLTRKLVLARAKASDLESVKKLNCWCVFCCLLAFSLINIIRFKTYDKYVQYGFTLRYMMNICV